MSLQVDQVGMSPVILELRGRREAACCIISSGSMMTTETGGEGLFVSKTTPNIKTPSYHTKTANYLPIEFRQLPAFQGRTLAQPPRNVHVAYKECRFFYFTR